MKPFDLEAAKRGEPIVTRDGRPVKFVAHAPDAKSEKLVCLVNGEILLYQDDGSFLSPNLSEPLDLFMVPPMRSIKGHEYPEPVTEPLEEGQVYWIADISTPSLSSSFRWLGDSTDYQWLKRCVAHLTKEAAEAHARALILAGGGVV